MLVRDQTLVKRQKELIINRTEKNDDYILATPHPLLLQTDRKNDEKVFCKFCIISQTPAKKHPSLNCSSCSTSR